MDRFEIIARPTIAVVSPATTSIHLFPPSDETATFTVIPPMLPPLTTSIPHEIVFEVRASTPAAPAPVAEAAPSPDGEAGPVTRATACPECGHVVGAADRHFCPVCGAYLGWP